MFMCERGGKFFVMEGEKVVARVFLKGGKVSTKAEGSFPVYGESGGKYTTTVMDLNGSMERTGRQLTPEQREERKRRELLGESDQDRIRVM